LSPAKALSVELFEEEKRALVKVPQDQLSLAIGKRGQNVRLAAKLSGWKIDVAGDEATLLADAEPVMSDTEPVAPIEISEETVAEGVESAAEVASEAKAE